MFEHPERISQGFLHWPLHAGIEVSLEPHDKIEVHLLEAQFFESMAALFNLTKRTCPTVTNLKTKAERKQAIALYRATASATIAFVEAFINSIGNEHALRNHRKLSQEQMALLTDTGK